MGGTKISLKIIEKVDGYYIRLNNSDIKRGTEGVGMYYTQRIAEKHGKITSVRS